jgi:hypothetical protein
MSSKLYDATKMQMTRASVTECRAPPALLGDVLVFFEDGSTCRGNDADSCWYPTEAAQGAASTLQEDGESGSVAAVIDAAHAAALQSLHSSQFCEGSSRFTRIQIWKEPLLQLHSSAALDQKQE